MIVVAACSSAGSNSAPALSATTSPPQTVAPIRNPGVLCSRFVDTLLDIARRGVDVPNSTVAARYRALAEAGRDAGEGIAPTIQHLADTLSDLAAGRGTQVAMLDAMSAVTRRCRDMGHPFSAAQAQELQRLFNQSLPTVPSTAAPAP